MVKLRAGSFNSGAWTAEVEEEEPVIPSLGRTHPPALVRGWGAIGARFWGQWGLGRGDLVAALDVDTFAIWQP